MDELYDEARNWCAANGQYLHMTGLTKDFAGTGYHIGRLSTGDSLCASGIRLGLLFKSCRVPYSGI